MTPVPFSNVTNETEIKVDISRCTVCQKAVPVCVALTENGRKRIKKAASFTNVLGYTLIGNQPLLEPNPVLRRIQQLLHV